MTVRFSRMVKPSTVSPTSCKNCERIVLVIIRLPPKAQSNTINYSFRIQNSQQSVNEDAHPIRPLGQLVAQLQQGAFEQVKPEQHARLIDGCRQEAGAPGRIEVTCPIQRAHPARPSLGPGSHGYGNFLPRDDAGDLAEKRRMRGIIQRAKHAGHIAQRASL